jgi:hypothetical protein
MQSTGANNDGTAFTNEGVETDANGNVLENVGQKRPPRDMSTYTCGRCGKKGHYPNECTSTDKPLGGKIPPAATAPTKDLTAHQNLMHGIELGEYDDVPQSAFALVTYHDETSLYNDTHTPIPKSWVLLDNQSTIDVFYNRALITNIRKSPTKMRIHCNAGVTTTDLVADFAGYGTVWFNPMA